MNPGAENDDLAAKARKHGIEVVARSGDVGQRDILVRLPAAAN
jgi:hypothetical protein